MELSLEDLLKQIDETKYLTLESTTAIDSFGCDIVPRLQKKLSLDEKNKNLSENDVWDPNQRSQNQQRYGKKCII